jgi:hypothetical protein
VVVAAACGRAAPPSLATESGTRLPERAVVVSPDRGRQPAELQEVWQEAFSHLVGQAIDVAPQRRHVAVVPLERGSAVRWPSRMAR